MQFLRQLYELLILGPIRLLMAPQKILTFPRRLGQMSLPAAVATIVAVFLIVCVTAFLIIAHSLEKRQHNLYVQAWVERVPLLILLVFLIPIFTYFGVKLWLEGEISAFDDIDRAWQLGVAELARHGIELRQTPLFLLLGCEDQHAEKALIAAAQLTLEVNHVPDAAAALHWYANHDAIYLACSRVGCLSRLIASSSSVLQELSSVDAAPGDERPRASIQGTLMPQDLKAIFKEIEAESPPSVGSKSAVGYNVDIRGTAMVNLNDPRETATASMSPDTAGKKRLVDLRREEVEVELRRMEHLCRLIDRARRPLSPINGALVAMPITLILADNTEGARIKETIRNDMEIMSQRLRLRFPITAIVVGLEKEHGFDELVQRVGRDRAMKQRFGKGFGVWDPPTPEELGALNLHACGAFEAWPHYLFREKDALEHKAGNRAIYSLLCKIRRNLSPRLDRILVGSFGHDPETEPNGEPPLFSGLYFAATGDTPAHQAFVRSVFERFPEQQEELQWNTAAIRKNGRYRTLAYAAMLAAAALAVTFVGLLYWKWR